MKATKQKTETTPAATVAEIRDELAKAENALAGIDPHRGTVDSVLELRRPLQEKISILRERLQLAEQRQAEAEYAQIESEIAELMEDSAQIENELALAREQAEADLRQHLNGDWLAGTGRYSTQRPAVNELLGHCVSVAEVEGRRDLIHAQIRSLERRIETRRQERSRQAAAARTDARRRLIEGEVVEVPLTPWRVECLAGFVQDVLDGLALRFIPGALPSPVEPIIHVLIPSGSQPRGWIDGGHIESASPLDPAELCPAMAAVWQRATPPKKRAASR